MQLQQRPGRRPLRLAPSALMLAALAAATAATVATAFILPSSPASRGAGAGMSSPVASSSSGGTIVGRAARTALFGKKRRREQDWCVYVGVVV